MPRFPGASAATPEYSGENGHRREPGARREHHREEQLEHSRVATGLENPSFIPFMANVAGAAGADVANDEINGYRSVRGGSVDDRNWRRLRSGGFRFPDGSSDRKRDWLSTAGQLSAILAGLAALTYLLGLLVLWVPIARTYTGDLTTAWHAVSLVPRPVVAGLGVGRLLPVPTLTLVGFAAYVLVLAGVGWYVHDHWGEGAIKWIVGIYAVLVAMVVVVFVELVPSRATYPFIAAMVATIAFSLIRGFIPGLSRERSRWVAFAVFITVLYVGSAVNVAFSAPPLPPVEISATTETKGKLLTHTEGFWYVFNREGDLIAIPPDEVKTVRVSSQDGG